MSAEHCLCCVLLAGLLAACGAGPAPTVPEAPPAPPAPPAAAPPLPLPAAPNAKLSDLPNERVRLHGSLRDAWRVPAGVTRLDFDAAAGATFLRFSALPGESTPVRAAVYQDGRGKPMPEVNGGTSWTARTTPISGEGPISLVLESEKPFYLAACGVVAGKPSRPDVLVYLIDTLRKDHLGCYGYPLATSPNIDAFAREAALFKAMTPMSSWTRPSVASLLTGTMDYTHHALSTDDRLREGLPSLARELAAAGWETHAMTANPAVGIEAGFGDGFAWYEEFWLGSAAIGWQQDMAVVDRAVAAISSAVGQPQFLYVHTMAPHREYDPPAEYAKLFKPERMVGTREQMRTAGDMALYDAEIRFSDAQFARVVQALKEAGRYENALIVLVSDHGEQFMEHGNNAHAKSLHFGEMGVPCIVKMPGNAHAGTTIRAVVRMADMAPTLLDLLGIAIPGGMEGRSLAPFVTLRGTAPPLPAFARLRGEDRHLYMGCAPGLKYLHNVERGEGLWYDLDHDPLELDPLVKPPPGGAELKAFADAEAARPVPAKGQGAAPLSPAAQEALKALGYL